MTDVKDIVRRLREEHTRQLSGGAARSVLREAAEALERLTETDNVLEVKLEEIMHEHDTDGHDGLMACDKIGSRPDEEAECDCGADEANRKLRIVWDLAVLTGAELLVDDRASSQEHDSSLVLLELPDQFLSRCKGQGYIGGNVLRGFIADLCFIDATDGYEGYNTNGSDERMLANDYFERANMKWDD